MKTISNFTRIKRTIQQFNFAHDGQKVTKEEIINALNNQNFQDKYVNYSTEETEEQKDLFEFQYLCPQNVQDLVSEWSCNEPTYTSAEALKNALEAIGYTCEYGLDGIPFDLRKMDLNFPPQENIETVVTEEKYIVETYFDVYEDSYEEGEIEHVNCWEYSNKVTAISKEQAIEKAFEELGLSFDFKHASVDEENPQFVHYSNLVDFDNNEANERDKEAWKLGDEKLYSANSTINVYRLEQVKFDLI